MSASLVLVRPRGAPGDARGQPGFWNDDQAYAAFLAAIEDDGESLACLRSLNLTPLLAVATNGRPEHEVLWTTPSELERAASELAGLVEARSERVARIVDRYDLGANHLDEVEVEFVRDLRDLATLAAWAGERGWERVAVEVNW